MIPPRVARLLSSGSTDTTFDPGDGPDAAAYAVACMANGTYLVGGEFTEVDGVPATNLALFNGDGTLADGFDINPDGAVRTVFPQADGKTIVAGQFVEAGGFSRSRIFRLQSSNTVEPAFNPNVDDTIFCSFIQQDGKILIGGDFGTVRGITRQGLARLLNDPISNSLQVQSSSTVSWGRAGTSPETQVVKFEVSTDGGSVWTPLGYGSRTPGGWTLTGLSLSGDGLLRATAYPSSSQSQNFMRDTISFDFIPLIQVEQPEGTPLTSGSSSLNYGSVQTGSTSDLTFVIRNIGLENLTLDDSTPPAITITGANADQWEIPEQPPLVISPQGTVDFVVSFIPTSTGSKVATLTIKSDSDTNPSFTVELTGVGTPGPGARDNSFQPVFNNLVYSAMIDPFNRVYYGGTFTTINGVAQSRFARSLSTGATDTSYPNTNVTNAVLCIAQQADGKVLLGGQFTSVRGTSRGRLARLTEAGALDTTFVANANNTVNSLDIQTDGKILVAGSFTTIGGVSRPGGLARVNADGTVDTGFSPWFVTGVPLRRASLLSSGAIMVLGSTDLYKITTTGVKDISFNATGQIAITGGTVYCVAEQTDGKLIIGGSFTAVGGTSRTNLARLNTDGTVDNTFSCNATGGTVNSIVLQTDGKILVSGSFTTIGGESQPRVARLTSDGVVDSTFVTDITAGTVYGLSVQEDGQMVTTGDYTVEGTVVKAARLLNDSASDTLTVVSATEVQWLRSGASAEVISVEFQFSQDGGTTWATAGFGERVEGGWSLTGILLPVSGILRSLASVKGGYGNGSLSLLESRISFSGLSSPDIQVEQPTNTVIADDGSVTFTGKLVGQIGILDFTIRNTGNATLSGISVVSSNPGEFQVTSLGATSITAGGVTTFQVRFSPAAIGARSATLTVGSNVPGFKNPYTISLAGNGITTPLAATSTAQSITSSGAVLRGTITARDDTASNIFQWRVGTAGAWNTVTASPASSSGFTAVNTTYSLGGLMSGTTYNFRAGVTNSVTGPSAPVFGVTLAFTTL